MTEAITNLRSCPTRADDAAVLIAHTISHATCHERQRGLYHKCHLCVHRGEASNPKVSAPLPKARAAKPHPAHG